jgi:hypothetical protein
MSGYCQLRYVSFALGFWRDNAGKNTLDKREKEMYAVD